MPLVSHEIVGHDDEHLALKFSMLNEGQVVFCQISDAALDELAGMEGTESNFRVAQFISLRHTIEQSASRLFDEELVLPGSVVKIFSRHLGTKPDQRGEDQTVGSGEQVARSTHSDFRDAAEQAPPVASHESHPTCGQRQGVLTRGPAGLPLLDFLTAPRRDGPIRRRGDRCIVLKQHNPEPATGGIASSNVQTSEPDYVHILNDVCTISVNYLASFSECVRCY
jgi:hypothetical protein